MIDTIYNKSCLDMSEIPDETIDCCVTSPPYWGLRDYQTATWEGGSINCDHKGKAMATRKNVHDRTQPQCNNKPDENVFEIYKDICKKCGAIRIDNQIGLEKTPELYVEKMVQVFSEVKRVLKPEGTLWLNLGDSYNSHSCGKGNVGGIEGKRKNKQDNIANTHRQKLNLKDKDLVGIPWMVAFALRSSGWYLRQDLIWAKPNPMPESVRDRCTKSHEYIFLLAKSQKYYYDYEAIQEVATGYDGRKDTYFKGGVKYEGFQEQTMLSRGHERWQFKNLQDKGQTTHTMHENRLNGEEYLSPVRNKRSVWTVTTKPFKGAHFATFPEDLIVPCILAGCPEGGIVLDPFMGAGTTALVAKRLDRHYVGYELNPDYIKIAEDRILSQNHSEKLF